MTQCEFCGANLPADARFCGKCGHVPRQVPPQATQMSDAPPLQFEQNSDELPTIRLEGNQEENEATLLLAPRRSRPLEGMPTSPLHAITLVPFDDDQEEEEKKRRQAALLGLGLLLPAEVAGEPLLEHLPSAPGTLQIAQVPSVQGTPSFAQPISAPASALDAPAQPDMDAPLIAPPQPGPPLPAPATPPPLLPATPPAGSGTPTSHPGYLLTLIVVMTTLLLILACIIGLGLTVWAPGLSLQGSSSVLPGSTMSLHGSSFLPNSSITLTLDSNIPIYYLQRPMSGQWAEKDVWAADSAVHLLQPSARGNNVLTTQSNGTFTVSFQVDPSWAPGQHAVHASETLTHRGASLNFIITQSASATATPTPGLTPTTTATPTVSLGLSCATPGSLTLGAVSELSSQAATGTITLCTSGSGKLTWNANWGASWLHLSQNIGSIQAPNKAQVIVTALATNLLAGNYSTTITFTNSQNKGTQKVTVTFPVQIGCVSATPQKMSFTGVAGMSNPSGSQTITVTNCGITSGWSARIATANNWLSINSANGTLNGGASGKIAVTASNLRAGLKAGTYTDTVVITIGSRTSNVAVSLQVLAAPSISVNPTSLNPNTQPCQYEPTGTGVNTCTVTLTNNSRNVALTWSSSASLGSGVTVTPANGHTIPAGGRESVTITFAANVCNVTVTITFTGPANSTTVTWSCVSIG